MRIKTIEEIRQDLITNLNTRLENLDLTEGTPERDMFVESQISGSLENIWAEIAYASKLHAPLVYYTELNEEDIDNYCATFGVYQRQATKSTGKVTFFTYTEPVDNIEVTDGLKVTTGGTNPIEFEVDGNYTIPYTVRHSYYNANEDRWEIECNVIAVNAGPDYRAATGTVNQLQTSVVGIEGVINNDPISGGEAEESISSRLSRVVDKFQGRDLGSTSGLLSFINIYATAVNIVGANDPLMERDNGLGGMIDIYIIGENLESYTEEVVITSSGLISGVNVSFTSTGVVFEKQPVDSIISLIKNDVVIDPDYYQLVKDTGLLKNSTRASDTIELTSTGIANIGPFEDSDVLEISYNYNYLLEEIETELNSTTNHYENRDYLLRGMTEVTVDMYMKFKEIAGQDFTSIADNVELELSSEINAVNNAGALELADLISVAKNYTGVDNIDLTTVSITPSGGGTKTAQGDIIFGKNEYPVAGTITLVRWTN